MQSRMILSLFATSLMLTGMSCTNRSEISAPPVPTAEAVSGSGSGPASADADTFVVRLETSKGNIDIEVHPEWAPRGARRFRELVETGFYDGCRFFRVLPDFMAQAGMNGDPQVHAKWADNTIPDDPVIESNQRGYVTFAKNSLPNSRSTQFFINFKDNSFLDSDGFAPFGKVVDGMEVASNIESKYREQPDQNMIRQQGNEYLKSRFPDLDFIRKASVLSE